MPEIKKVISRYSEELIRLRRDFHQHPELGFEEHRTADIIADYLVSCGLEVNRMAKTGVVGLLRGSGSGKTLLLRADMDALPVHEQNESLAYCSVNKGIMHACGHDGHMAMMLIAAQILAKLKSKLNGNIKFVFQPNEEDAGAYLMIDEGVMDNPKVDAAVGLHLWSDLETGKIDIFDGPVMAASHYFYLTVKGKGGHAGSVHRAVDPISISAGIIQAVQSMQTRELDSLEPVAIVFTKINAGSSPTIVPEEVKMQGSIRFLSAEGAAVKEAFERVVAGICSLNKAEYELKYKIGNEIVSNDSQMVKIARRAALECLGNEKMLSAAFRSMGGEDFSEYIRSVPGVFFFIGSGNCDKKTDYSHHHPCFNIDEDALLTGTEMLVRVALKYLNG